MSNLWVEIEALVLDGVPLNAVEGRRLAYLTEIALMRLLDQRGTTARLEVSEPGEKKNPAPSKMTVPPGANEARWAEELALVLYRAMDRTL
jgi:hypothetical protein